MDGIVAQTSGNLPTHIKKGHQLVFARQDLSAKEQDVFGLMMAHMKETDWAQGTPRYEFSCHQLADWFDMDSSHVADTLSPVADRLSKRSIGVRNVGENGVTEFDYAGYFKRIKYKHAKLVMVPNDELKQEYVSYQQGFALITAKNFFGLNREHSKKLYEILSRFKTGGTSMKPVKLNELRGMFGLLDQQGNLKKKSYANNGVVMARCIRDSITEISTNPRTSKEILFLKDDETGNVGYRVRKDGNTIIEIEFLYRWLAKDPVAGLNQEEALRLIRELEINKRTLKKERLEIDELEQLLSAYKYLGKEDKVEAITQAIAKRTAEEASNEETTSTEDVDKLLEKVAELQKDINADDY
ncbi:RepB family plasmid replication initiator protein [Neiella sp. HB171785]|uniref:RepB family plasmid replication initiator protein n=2 Tax=Neiella litorisoli TaxID=2771431 RepID=A0A8J6QJS0_9GAMM|nr:RepB family plasmid replication initiator protein [Neiella litorisoli]